LAGGPGRLAWAVMYGLDDWLRTVTGFSITGYYDALAAGAGTCKSFEVELLPCQPNSRLTVFMNLPHPKLIMAERNCRWMNFTVGGGRSTRRPQNSPRAWLRFVPPTPRWKPGTAVGPHGWRCVNHANDWGWLLTNEIHRHYTSRRRARLQRD